MNPSSDADRGDVQVWPSYTDVAMNIILILLMYLFAQALVASQSTAGMAEIRRRQMNLEESLMRAVPAEMRSALDIRRDGNLLRLAFSDGVLFDPSQADLLQQGEDLLKWVGRVLLNKSKTFMSIQIEGHTDNKPIHTDKFPSNWELSSARATSVVRFLQDSAGIEAGKLTAMGYSEYHPVADNETEEGRARNRRIEMVVVYSLLREDG